MRHIVGICVLLFALASCSGLGDTFSRLGGSASEFGSTVKNTVKESPGPTAGTVGGVWMAQQLGYLKPEYFTGALIAYAIYDPFAPTWEIKVTELDSGFCRIDLNMKRLTTGGDGEARQTFLRAARTLVAKGSYAGFDELHYEEGIESTRPFARRVASGEIRLVKPPSSDGAH
jgi:hypothetical protein